jgi:hypothetical protein
MKLIIDREWWLRGEGGGMSRLLRVEDRKMCCVGSFALQILKMRESQIEDAKTLSDVRDTDCGWPITLNKVPIGSMSEFYSVNDNLSISDDVREYALKKLFAKLGVVVEFTGPERMEVNR